MDFFFNSVEKTLVTVGYLAAHSTQKMVMVSFLRMMIDKPVVELAFYYTAKTMQQIEGSINRRFIHAGQPGLYLVKHLFGGKVTIGAMNDIQDQPALRSELETVLL